MNTLSELFKKHNIIGLVGNRNTAKSSLILSQLVELKHENPKVSVYVFGVEENLKNYLTSRGISWLYSKHDILDLKIRDSVIFIDEVGDFFSTASRDKESDKVKKFINRVAHLNDYVVLGTAEAGWFNKMACSLIDTFLVKKIDFDRLVNGTSLKNIVLGLETTSDYRLDIPNNEYFVISSGLTEKRVFGYFPELDSKKNNVNPFVVKKCDEKGGENCEKIVNKKEMK